MFTSKRTITIFILVAVIVILGSLLISDRQQEKTTQQQQTEYSLLAKRLFVEDPNDTLINFIPLRAALKKYLASTGIEHSLMLEYLPTGTTVRVDENNKLVGASLLKLPVVISLYKAVEQGKISLDQTITITQEMIDNRFGELWRKGPGAKITLREAVRLTLIESDNTAANVITKGLGNTVADNESVLAELDIEVQTTGTETTRISARDYSSILKCLYLSCYLHRNDSQDILRQLSEAVDFGRIASGIPSEVAVAHKIGVYGDDVQSDCGIVYIPNRPYTICIMLRANPNEAAKHMHMISKLAYDYINDQER